MTAPDAQPPAEPHDPTHLMYDADTGICCDCPRMVDPLAPLVAAALPDAVKTWHAVSDEYGSIETEDAEHALTLVLRVAFRAARPASAALAGTTTPIGPSASQLEDMAQTIDDALDHTHNFDGLGDHEERLEETARQLRKFAALLASTPTEETDHATG